MKLRKPQQHAISKTMHKSGDEIGFWESMVIAVILSAMFLAVVGYGIKYAESRRIHWEATRP